MTASAMNGTGYPATVLRNAAEYLEANGWIQSEYFASDADMPAACAMGAIQYTVVGRAVDVSGDDFVVSPDADKQICAVDRVARVLATYLVGEGFDPPDRYGQDAVAVWNDHFGRTATEVTAAMRRAADWYDRNSGGGA